MSVDALELDSLVQDILKDTRYPAGERAQVAAAYIKVRVIEGTNLLPDTPLPIPREWQHKVPESKPVWDPLAGVKRRRWWHRRG